MNEQQNKRDDGQFVCEICGTTDPFFSWTDTHGVAQCRCGTPYTIYHYEGELGNQRRVDKPPTICFKSEYVPVIKRYWEENHCTIPSGFSFSQDYERATPDDAKAFHSWLEHNADAMIDEAKK